MAIPNTFGRDPGRVRRARHTVCLVAAACLLAFSSAFGQLDRPALAVSAEAFPGAGMADPDTLAVGGQPNFERALEARIRRLSVEFTAPVYRASARTSLAATFAYSRYDVDLRGWSQAQAGRPIKSPQSFEVGVSLRRRLESGWIVRMDAVPGLFSDFLGEIGLDDLRMRGELVFHRLLGEALTVGLGVGYDQAYGHGLPLPRVELQWVAADAVLLDLMLPTRAALWYDPTPRVAFGVLFNVSGAAHHGDPELYRVPDPETRVSAGTFGPSLLIRATENIRIHVDSGVSFFKRLDLFDGGHGLRSLDPERTAFGRVRLELWR